MMRYRILDLETVPHPDAHAWVDPVKPDARLKDPAKIAESIREKTAARDEAFGLDPDCCRIVALGFHDVGYGDPTVYLVDGLDGECRATEGHAATGAAIVSATARGDGAVVNRGPEWSRTWRMHGREWAIYGEEERSEWCHERADFLAMPWWKTILVGPPRRKKPKLKSKE